MLFRDCGPHGNIIIKTLCMVFLTKEELKEYKKIERRPFWAKVLWQRMPDATEERFGDRNTTPRAHNFLPHCMRPLWQGTGCGCPGTRVRAYRKGCNTREQVARAKRGFRHPKEE